MKFVPLPDDDLPADFRARLGFADGVGPHGERWHTRDDPPLPTLEMSMPNPWPAKSPHRANG
jgi:hypothetical protein